MDTILETYKSANWLAVIDSQTGRKCATLESLSTTTKMASFPFWVFGKPVMKSILTLSHFHSRIGNGLIVLAGLWCSALTRCQTSHSAMNCAISLFIRVHQNLWRRSWYIFVLPG